MPYAFRRVWREFSQRLRERLFGSPILFVTGRRAQYERIWRRAADELGAHFVERASDLWEVRRGEQATWICNHQVEIDTPPLLRMLGRKPLVARLLREAGLPLPEQRLLDYRDRARGLAFLRAQEGPIVVKPAHGTGSGMGITTHVLTPREYDRAAILASLHSREILLERQVAGESYRLLCLAGEMIHAVRRTGPRVTGDGSSSIRALAGDLDRDAQFTLRSQGLDAAAVPATGRAILVRSAPVAGYRRDELLTSYDEDVTGLVEGRIVEAAERAARTVRAELVGVDLIAKDPAGPPDAILELNATPGLHHHELPPGNDAAVRVLRYALERAPATHWSGAQG